MNSQNQGDDAWVTAAIIGGAALLLGGVGAAALLGGRREEALMAMKRKKQPVEPELEPWEKERAKEAVDDYWQHLPEAGDFEVSSWAIIREYTPAEDIAYNRAYYKQIVEYLDEARGI